ncbi:hypothetical protein [Methylophilus sp.]|jgi:hypothetical protein|uniref:hypothetical protein n=1 Tax=Methylophilus sp. TaxID=29541 RepID=UPI0025FF4C14|nr:hypothetical protein [Methylophilus sp.]
MAVLSPILQRLRFVCQQTWQSHRWLLVMLLITMVLSALIAQAWWLRQTLQVAIQALPMQTREAMQARVAPLTRPVATTAAQTWPVEDEADRISAEILATADAMGMLFERAEFQSIALEQSRLQVQRIKLPLKGDYLQVRHFLQQVLQHYPSLALSQFKLQRSDVMQPELEAYVEFSLYTRKRGQP